MEPNWIIEVWKDGLSYWVIADNPFGYYLDITSDNDKATLFHRQYVGEIIERLFEKYSTIDNVEAGPLADSSAELA